MGDQDGYPCATLISEIMTAQTGDIPIGISLGWTCWQQARESSECNARYAGHL